MNSNLVKHLMNWLCGIPSMKTSLTVFVIFGYQFVVVATLNASEEPPGHQTTLVIQQGTEQTRAVRIRYFPASEGHHRAKLDFAICPIGSISGASLTIGDNCEFLGSPTGISEESLVTMAASIDRRYWSREVMNFAAITFPMILGGGAGWHLGQRNFVRQLIIQGKDFLKRFGLRNLREQDVSEIFFGVPLALLNGRADAAHRGFTVGLYVGAGFSAANGYLFALENPATSEREAVGLAFQRSALIVSDNLQEFINNITSLLSRARGPL
jgi:hypothetical protein